MEKKVGNIQVSSYEPGKFIVFSNEFMYRGKQIRFTCSFSNGVHKTDCFYASYNGDPFRKLSDAARNLIVFTATEIYNKFKDDPEIKKQVELEYSKKIIQSLKSKVEQLEKELLETKELLDKHEKEYQLLSN
jgi:hypothetical protein